MDPDRPGPSPPGQQQPFPVPEPEIEEARAVSPAPPAGRRRVLLSTHPPPPALGCQNILQMSDDDLLAIFMYFDLQELFYLITVCRRFLAIVERTCNSLHGLKLFHVADQVRMYEASSVRELYLHHSENDVLVIPRIGLNYRIIPELMPVVHRLTAFFASSPASSRYNLQHMLRSQWYQHLESITLIQPDNAAENERMDEIFYQVCDATDTLVSLKSLHLFNVYRWSIPAHMPVLGLLHHFTLWGYDGQLRQVISQLSELCTCLNLKVRRPQIWDHDPDNLADYNLLLSCHLRELTFVSTHMNAPTYRDLIGLTTLDLSLNPEFNFASMDLIDTLSRMPNLRTFRVNVLHLELHFELHAVHDHPEVLNAYIDDRMPRVMSVTNLAVSNVWNSQEFPHWHGVAIAFPEIDQLVVFREPETQEAEVAHFHETYMREFTPRNNRVQLSFQNRF